MNEYSDEIRKIANQFKSIEKEVDKLNAELIQINNEQQNLESSYIRITNKIQKNSNILKELENVITILKDKKDKIAEYEQFTKNKKKSRLFQTVIVMGICLILTSPLIIIDIIAYLEIFFLGTMLIGFSNTIKYFNDIKARKELVKTNDIDKISDDIIKKQKQKEFAECIEVKLNVKKVALINEIEVLTQRRESIFNRLEYLNDCIIKLMRTLSQKLDNVSIEEDAFNQENSHIKVKTKR